MSVADGWGAVSDCVGGGATLTSEASVMSGFAVAAADDEGAGIPVAAGGCVGMLILVSRTEVGRTVEGASVEATADDEDGYAWTGASDEMVGAAKETREVGMTGTLEIGCVRVVAGVAATAIGVRVSTLTVLPVLSTQTMISGAVTVTMSVTTS